LIVQQSDCASDLEVGNAPDEKFPPVFATTRMIALMEMAGAREVLASSSSFLKYAAEKILR
jgi:predicted thioesterase